VLKKVLQRLDDLYRAVKAGHSLTGEWAAQLETLGRNVQVRWLDQVVAGRAESVNEQGSLILTRVDGSTFTALAGEVTLQV
jgi:biotin-(acetyl-CoA carboxylase) ligase